jgi:hypothetical protein
MAITFEKKVSKNAHSKKQYTPVHKRNQALMCWDEKILCAYNNNIVICEIIVGTPQERYPYLAQRITAQ